MSENTAKTVAQNHGRAYYTPIRATGATTACGQPVKENDIIQYDGSGGFMPSQVMIVSYDSERDEWMYKSNITSHRCRFDAIGGLQRIMRHCIHLGSKQTNPELYAEIES